MSCVVKYSPRGNVAEDIINMFRNEGPIRIASYSFTSNPITLALLDQKKAGRDIKMVTDKVQKGNAAQKTALSLLCRNNIEVRVSRLPVQHNKFITVGTQYFQTGSYNYSNNAEYNNGENSLVCASEKGNRLYRQNWQKLWDNSVPYECPAE